MRNYLGPFTLEVLEIVVRDCGDGAAASAPTSARAHGVEVAVLQIATLVVGAVVSVAMLTLTVLPLVEIQLLSRAIVLLQVVRSCVEYRSMISEKTRFPVIYERYT